MPVDPGTATLATGGLSALTGFLGSGMSNKSVKRSIKAAKEINQINNEFNASEALKNRDFQTSEREASQQWNLDQWNRENAYNDPSAQRARMEAAGFNPYNMNIDAGSASTSATQSSTSSFLPLLLILRRSASCCITLDFWRCTSVNSRSKRSTIR